MAQCGSVLRMRAAKGLSRWFPAWFRADSGTNLLKQAAIDTGLPFGPIAQWSRVLAKSVGVLGSSPGRVMCFFLPYDICITQAKSIKAVCLAKTT